MSETEQKKSPLGSAGLLDDAVDAIKEQYEAETGESAGVFVMVFNREAGQQNKGIGLNWMCNVDVRAVAILLTQLGKEIGRIEGQAPEGKA